MYNVTFMFLFPDVSGRVWWDHRHLPNIKFIHFNDLLADLPGTIREIASFVEIPIIEEHFDEVVRQNTFNVMKENAASNPILDIHNQLFVGGAHAFMNKVILYDVFVS